MGEPKILFVVGAGASNEVGLPVGVTLVREIANVLAIKFEFSRQISGDSKIVDALRLHARSAEMRNVDIDAYLEAGWQIVAGMAQAPSIDSFLDSSSNHMHHEEMVVIGKLAIARSILRAEAKSRMYMDSSIIHENAPFIGQLRDTWYWHLMRIISDGANGGNINDRLKNLSFVVFNYDRCIEHFLYYSIQNYYNFSPVEAADSMANVEIIHPYGSMGRLPWQSDEQSVEFGNEVGGSKLFSSSQQIKTFAEQNEDSEAQCVVQRLIKQSDIIVFLGFAFHGPNLQLLHSRANPQGTRIFATALGMSDADRNVIEGEVINTFRGGNINLNMRNNMKCDDLLSEYQRSISF